MQSYMVVIIKNVYTVVYRETVGTRTNVQDLMHVKYDFSALEFFIK